MSESQVNQKVNNQNPSAAGDVSGGSTPPEQPAAQTQNSTIMPGAGASVTDDPVQFDSAHIGTHTAKKQDLFAEQNRLAGEKAQRSAKTRKKILIIVGTIVGVVLVGLIVWLVVLKSMPQTDTDTNNSTSKTEPTIVDDSDAGIAKMRELAQSEYNSGKRIAEIDQLFADEAAVTKPEYLNQLHLAQILFYTGNGFYQQAADLSATIDSEGLPLAQKGIFYDAMYSTYTGLKDTAKAGEYFALSYEVQVEIQGYDEGDDGRDGI